MDKTITVTLESGDVVVRKLALGDYAQLFKLIRTLPGELAMFIEGSDKKQLKNLDFKKFLPEFLPMVGESWPEVIAVLALPTDKDSEWLSTNADLADALDILNAALDLNDYSRVAAAIKKLTARRNSTKAEAVQEADPQTPEAEPKTT